jgi:tRNA-splicing ligase RtcB (3'-phosphate/5'-hydroxy nucleic acid ligase)
MYNPIMKELKITRIDPFRLKIEKHGDMRTHGIIYANSDIENYLHNDQAMNQVANVACLPGIVGPSMAMPDIHWGYGFPIGGVAAFSMKDGIVSPGGVGYDINCGIRCLKTNLTIDQVSPVIERLVASLFNAVPSGVGSRNRSFKISQPDFRQILIKGASWVIKQGFAPEDDLECHEDYGCIPGANPDSVSKKAIDRGLPEFGTLGSGNHFLEIDFVDEVFDKDIAQTFGLFEKQIVVQVHTGSRGLGHQICTDYIHQMIETAAKEGIVLPDRQLACAPLASSEAKKYFGAMASAANFAYANREIITFLIRECFENIFSKSFEKLGINLLYDCCHNIAKIEKVKSEGRELEVCIHRKGATRALLSGDKRLPDRFIRTGQPVLVPGDMGRESYILVGSIKAEDTFFSACHGAGRLMSRSEAKRKAKERTVIDGLRVKGIHVLAASRATLVEEMPEAYKDVSKVVDTISGAGIATRVARLKPMGIIKG